MSDPSLPELAAERDRPGPVHHKGAGPPPGGWLDPRGRELGGRAFALHRLTGVVLVGYLYVHLGVLSMLLIGSSSWNGFLGVVTAKGFLAFEALLILAVIFHGLNGLRVALVGSGVMVSRQRALFWIAVALGVAAITGTVLHLFGAV